MLLHIPQVLTQSELAEVTALLAAAQWVDGRTTAGTQAAMVKNNQQLPEAAPQLARIRQIVLAALQQNGLFFSAALPTRVLPPFVNRYQADHNYYGQHVDNAMRMMPDGSGYVRADISATLFFSQPQDYTGGELVIDGTFGLQSVKLNAGDMVLYPSSSVHEVMPVTHGTRLACFMFIQSMVRDAEQRRILYDMDTALIGLRQTMGETREVVRLTGVYHNLLRQWAQ